MIQIKLTKSTLSQCNCLLGGMNSTIGNQVFRRRYTEFIPLLPTFSKIVFDRRNKGPMAAAGADIIITYRPCLTSSPLILGPSPSSFCSQYSCQNFPNLLLTLQDYGLNPTFQSFDTSVLYRQHAVAGIKRRCYTMQEDSLKRHIICNNCSSAFILAVTLTHS